MNRAAPDAPLRSATPAWAGWLLVVALILLGAASLRSDSAGAANGEGPGEGEAGEGDGEPARAQQVARGAEIYQLSCASCHGAAGGGSEIAPGLQDVSSTYIDLVLRTNRMPPGDLSPDTAGNTKGALDLSAEDRMAVVAFTEEVFALEGDIPDVGEGDPAQGLLVWGTHCASCHGAAGQGGVAGRGAFTPPVAGLDAVTIAEAVRVGPFDMPRFSETVVDEEDIADVAAFMDLVAEEEGTPVGLTETNPVYLAGLAGLLSLVVLVSCLWLAGRPLHFRSGSQGGAADGGAPRPEGTGSDSDQMPDQDPEDG